MKKLILLLLTLGFCTYEIQASSANTEEELPSVYTAKRNALDQFMKIKGTLKSADDFSEELASFATDIVEKVEKTISLEDPRREGFDLISSYASAEIENKTLSLNRLNYLTLQLAISLNPDLSSPFEIFEGLNLLIQPKLWMLPYDEGKSQAETYVAENMKDVNPNDFESPQNALLTFFRPCDRGLWVFPLVCDAPIYGLKTYAEAFAEGIAIVGLPLKANACDVHAGLIKKGDFAYFLAHDLLHLQSIAPSLNPLENETHMKAMIKVVSVLMPKITVLLSKEQQKAFGNLFWITHELTDYAYQVEHGLPLFSERTSTDKVLKAMIAHAKWYLERYLSPNLQDRQTYYPHYFDVVSGEGHPKIGNRKITVHNEDGSEETIKLPAAENCEPTPIPFNFKNQFYVRTVDYIDGYNGNVFYNFTTQRAFAYSIVSLMKYMGLGDDGTGTYGATLDAYDPVVAYKKMIELIDAFAEKFSA